MDEMQGEKNQEDAGPQSEEDARSAARLVGQERLLRFPMMALIPAMSLKRSIQTRTV
jgi:hypothetical protein